MNNLHRQLAPISEAAWGEIDQEARRTFIRWIAGRRVVDVVGPDGEDLAAVRTGHQVCVDTPFEGVQAHQRQVRQIVELRVPFRVSREAVDAVDRGAQDSDWQPVKDGCSDRQGRGRHCLRRTGERRHRGTGSLKLQPCRIAPAAEGSS